MGALQQSALARFQNRISWSSLGGLQQGVKGIVFSNELVDAIPVHRVRMTAGALEEQFVTVADDGLSLAWGPASTPRLERYLARLGTGLEAGQIVEICLDALDWLERISSVLAEGFLVTIDYGDEVAGLFSPARRDGTLRCFHRHHLCDNPLARVGEQDITASVNFTALIEYGFDFGLEPVSFEPQGRFLIKWGLLDVAAGLKGRQPRLLVKNLLVPGGVSDNFRVLVQRKAVHNSSFEM